MGNLSFIYFDVGGVVALDFSANDGWIDLKKELGVAPDKYEAFDAIFTQYERVICTFQEVSIMKDVLNQRLGLSIPPTYPLLDGFVKRFEPNPTLWPIIQKAKGKYPIGLFTMMYPGMLAGLQDANIVPTIQWNIVIDSSVIGYTKYDREMFDIATQEAHTPKEEILLVENSARHIQTANEYGWQTFLYNPKDIAKSNRELNKRIRVI